MKFADPKQFLAKALRDLVPRRLRTFTEFAETEIKFPRRPKLPRDFSVSWMPWTGEVLKAFDDGVRGRGTYRRFFGMGPVQSGKTVLFFQIPVMYFIFEMGWDVIIGVPTLDLASSIYEERLLYAIQNSSFKELLPKSGPGSRGGVIKDSVTFRNGATLRFMAAGGGDAQRSSYTAPVVILTEIDKYDEARESSSEADPISQMEARTRAFGSSALIFGECTVSSTKGRIFQEVKKSGSNHTVFMPCWSCGQKTAFFRDDLKGWEETDDILAARDSAYLQSRCCGAHWTDGLRVEALKSPTVEPEEGEVKRTNTYGFWWNGTANATISIADIAEEEWRAKALGTNDAEKRVRQFTWVEPWDEDIVVLDRLTPNLVREKQVPVAKRTAPADCITVGVDVSASRLHWVAIAWKGKTGIVWDFGYVNILKTEAPDVAITKHIKDLHDELAKVLPTTRNMMFVDTGWLPQAVYNARRPGLVPIKGKHEGHPLQMTKGGDGRALLNINVSLYKRLVHHGFLLADHTVEGSISLFLNVPRAFDEYARHICAEHEEQVFKQGTKGLVTQWIVKSKNNHWLDATTYARAGADFMGVFQNAQVVSGEPTRE